MRKEEDHHNIHKKDLCDTFVVDDGLPSEPEGILRFHTIDIGDSGRTGLIVEVGTDVVVQREIQTQQNW